LGITRAVESKFEYITEEESAIYVNYAAGINKVAENLKVYPMEFYVLMTSFEPWTVKDSLACEYLFNAMLSTDWFAEMLRVRLLEIYDRDLVDQLLPFKAEHISPTATTTVSDEDLAKIGMLYDEAGLSHSIDESLLYMPPRVDKLEVDPLRLR